MNERFNASLHNRELSVAIADASAFIARHADVLPLMTQESGRFYGETKIQDDDGEGFTVAFRALDSIFGPDAAHLSGHPLNFVKGFNVYAQDAAVLVTVALKFKHYGYEDLRWPAYSETAPISVPVDAWGRPLVTPDDGHSAWACNDRGCQIHQASLYGDVEKTSNAIPTKVTGDVLTEALRLVHDGRRISAIKYVRDHTGVSLFEAKTIVNTMRDYDATIRPPR